MAADSTYILGCILIVLSGMMLAAQAGMNSTLGGQCGRSFASVVTFTVGLAPLVGFFVIDVYAMKRTPEPSYAAVSGTPWWSWLGGFMGAFYVTMVIIFARKLGPGTLQALFLTANLLTSVLLDTQGWLNFRIRPLHWGRILGVCLMLVGVALVTYFDGTRDMKRPSPNAAMAVVTQPIVTAAATQQPSVATTRIALARQDSGALELRALMQPSESTNMGPLSPAYKRVLESGLSSQWLLKDPQMTGQRLGGMAKMGRENAAPAVLAHAQQHDVAQGKGMRQHGSVLVEGDDGQAVSSGQYAEGGSANAQAVLMQAALAEPVLGTASLHGMIAGLGSDTMQRVAAQERASSDTLNGGIQRPISLRHQEAGMHDGAAEDDPHAHGADVLRHSEPCNNACHRQQAAIAHADE